ncbi:hypothetical protein BKA82DRAFT_2053733 [Pisolithus tinctorius]|nr:hypothetical protein BKA82DRAFT_2053733 [Pisolithus tinctorius]
MPVTRASPAFEPGLCHICDKKLSRKADLPRHMRTHAANKEAFMFPCPYAGCEYKALQRSNLTTHIHTHTGARPNKCPHPECTYTTSDPGSLTRHRRKAHGYDPKDKKTRSSATKSCKKTRKRERHSPYPTSSPSSSEDSSFDEFTWLERQLSELDELFAEQSSCSALIPGLVAPNTYPAYDSALATRAASYDNLPSVSYLVEDPFNPELLCSRGIEIPTVSYPSIFQGFEQELPYIQSGADISNLWVPVPSPGDSDSIFSGPAYNACQQGFVAPIQPLQSAGVFPHNDSPSLTSGVSRPPLAEFDGGFAFTDVLGPQGFLGFPSVNGFGVGAADTFPQIHLQC